MCYGPKSSKIFYSLKGILILKCESLQSKIVKRKYEKKKKENTSEIT